ncbi:nuclear transport factor 2 family protein [Halobacillus sp. SY10]|uniref:Predicted SnoaL-like aldol condensation-catalyzing enzyme n=2 Tax=Halobacillus TaxID=45667 RepID=A0A1H0G3B7_HALAD|nr:MULTISPECIES: nuclear transport factor 2 family protein [Halobacillus]RDY70643.1 nuclear transport factor 2 family protein [Halobacillus trueperi]SDO01324.1 Predicted SnoaL-like aldol condensation-catalyzing enzyme [Halobacillus aidingensis]
MSSASLSNKERAVSFLKQVADGEVRDAYQTYISSGFSHHNPYFQGDKGSLMRAMEEDASKNPHKTLEVHRAIEEKDFVVVHSHIKQNQEDTGAAVVHMMRFDNGKIIELWDIGQPIPEDTPNENGAF